MCRQDLSPADPLASFHVAVFGGLLNAFGLLVTARSPGLRKNTHSWFLIVLMASDLLSSVLFLPMTAASFLIGRFIFDLEVSCHLFSVVSNANLAISMLCQASMALCRLKGTHSNFEPTTEAKPLKLAAVIISILLVALAIMLIPELKILGEVTYEPSLFMCMARPIKHVQLWNAAIAAGVLLPFTIIVGSYAAIYYRVRRTYLKVLPSSEVNGLLRARQMRKQKLVGKTSLIIGLNFFFCFFPSAILMIFDRNRPSCPDINFYFICNIILWSGGISNPIIYFYSLHKAKRASKKLVRKLCTGSGKRRKKLLLSQQIPADFFQALSLCPFGPVRPLSANTKHYICLDVEQSI